MVKALARAFRWRKMLDEGVHATLEDLARAKGVHATYVSRILRLTLLAPEIVEAILDGRPPEGMRLEELLGGQLSGPSNACSHVRRRERRRCIHSIRWPRRPSAKSRDYFSSGVAPVSNRVIFPSFRA